MPGCNMQYQEFMIVCMCQHSALYNYSYGLLASQLVHLALSKVTEWYIILFEQWYSPIMLALCLMLLVTYRALNYAGIIGLGLFCA